MHDVFVFGTLKKGFPLHDEGLGGATFLGHFETVESYPMLIAGPWFSPMMLDEPGTGVQVRGELYQVDGSTLAALDRLESVGQPGNLRRVLQVTPIGGQARRWAFAYMKTRALAHPLHTAYLQEYVDDRFVQPNRRFVF
jgi:gamma-glutamylaminecyclotransferase